jgi:hypothetical protein
MTTFDDAYAYDARAERPRACDHCGEADRTGDLYCDACEDMLAADAAPTSDDAIDAEREAGSAYSRACIAVGKALDHWLTVRGAESYAAYQSARAERDAAQARYEAAAKATTAALKADRIGRLLRVVTWGAR